MLSVYRALLLLLGQKKKRFRRVIEVSRRMQKEGAGARGDKRACQQTFNLRDRQLIQGMYEDRSSPGLKVVKRNSSVIRNQENVLKTRSVAIPTR